MANLTTQMESPIDVTLLFHEALRSIASRSVGLASELDKGGTLQAFNLAFNSWATALMFYTEQSDSLINKPLSGRLASSNADDAASVDKIKIALLSREEDNHMELLGIIEDVFMVLNVDIGGTTVITRTMQHLLGASVKLQIAQEDHLEIEETLLQPILRQHLDHQEQLGAAKALLIDELADNSRWVIDWIAGELNEEQTQKLFKLEKQLS